uniref:Uncharacterized protein n=1 Tax=Ditylenchus dipsaci TaxID=166011 RepID=A0A915CUL0_9BILA
MTHHSRPLYSSSPPTSNLYAHIVDISTVVHLVCLCLLADLCAVAAASSSSNYQINGQKYAQGKQPNVDWVPIVERKSHNNLTTIVLDVFQNAELNDRVTAEKVGRISKMLNTSLEMQEKEMLEAAKSLKALPLNQMPSTTAHVPPLFTHSFIWLYSQFSSF